MANEKRLIDANALKMQFIDYVRTPPHFHYGDWQNMCIHGTEIDEIIENAPTVDAVEVVHGEWKKYHDHFTKRQVGWICSNCSAVSYDLSNGDTPFCPHCGAMMDLEDDEDA